MLTLERREEIRETMQYWLEKYLENNTVYADICQDVARTDEERNYLKGCDFFVEVVESKHTDNV